MKTKSIKTKMITVLLTLCMGLSIVPVTALAAGVNYIDRIHVDYVHRDYKAGDTPQPTASVTEGNCTVAYEYWREIYQKEEGSFWSGTGRYWYSDPDKMASLPADKRITQFEAGHHYSYNIVLVADRGYYIGEDETVVSVGEYEWGTPGKHTNLEIKEMSTKLYIYSPYSIDLPDDSNDKVITDVSIVNVNKNLDSSQPISFTARPATYCAEKFDITEESWEAAYNENNPINDVIKSTDATPHAPIAGGEYWYSIVLTAKDGYVFSKDFSDENCSIKEGSDVNFTLDGILYENRVHVSDDGKTLTAWEFMNPITAKGSTQSLINEVVIYDVKFDYQPGDVPQKGAKIFLPGDSDKYEIEYEYWEEMQKNEDGSLTPVAYWYSDENKNNALEQDKKITAFEEGKTYMYSISLKAKDGYAFSENCPVMVEDFMVDSANIIKTQNGLFVTAVKTIKPTKPVEKKEIEVIEINNATLTFNDGDKPVFTGTTPDGAKYVLVYEAWKTDGEGISSAEFFNDDDHLTVWGGKLITTFDKNKTYTYMLYLKTTAEAGEDGWFFGPNTKLKINGNEVAFVRNSSDNEQQFSGATKLTMTPQASGTTPDYKIIEGANGTWTQKSDSTLTFRANGDFSKFTEIKVDGNTISADKYTAVSGSTVITLKNDYLATLSVGKHTLTVVYNDGECSTEFEIKTTDTIPGNSEPGNNQGSNKPSESNSNTGTPASPKTSDSSSIFLWLVLLFISGGVLVGTSVVTKKKKYNS